MEATIDSYFKTAKVAGILYIILVCIAIYGMDYVPSKIIVPLEAAATANNILSNEFLYRTGIISHLISTTMIAVVVLLLYRIFRTVDKHLSRLMVAPVLVQVPIVLFLETFHIAALFALESETLALDVNQRQELSYFLLRMFGFGIGASQLFWGLWLFPFGLVVLKAKYIPRIFGILLLINGIGYLIEGIAYILLERQNYLLVRQFARLTFIGLPVTMLWFLYVGIFRKPHRKN